MIKVCIIGPQNSGKAWFTDCINRKYKGTTTNDNAISFFQSKTILDSKNFNIQYWNILGKKSCLKLAKTYIKSADYILVFLSLKLIQSKSLLQWTQCLQHEKEKTILLLDGTLSNLKLTQLQTEIRKRGWRVQKIKFGLEQQYEKLQKLLIRQKQPVVKIDQNLKQFQKKQFVSKQNMLSWSILGIGLLLSASFLKKFS